MPHADDGQLNALLDGELEPAEAQAIEAHLASCPVCAKRYEEAKHFLAESASLLDVLVPAELPAPRPEAAAGATAVPAEPLSAPSVPQRRASKTAKEIALDIDGSTQKSPAIRPLFPREVERRTAEENAKAASPVRKVDWSQLAWAATVVLAVSVGYMVNEVQRARRASPEEGFAAAAPRPTEVQPGESVAAPGVGSVRRTAPSGAQRQRAVAIKPPTARGTKPLPPDRAADAALDASPLAQPPGGAAAGVAGAGVGGAIVTREPPRPVAPSAAAGTAPTSPSRVAERRAPAAQLNTPAPTVPAAPAAARTRAADEVATPTRAAEGIRTRSPRVDTTRLQAAVTTFRRVSLDQAARRLSGAIRLIDGRPWDHVELGPGRLVPGADRDLEVVRVFYFDDRGRPLILDQQRIPTPADTAGSGEVAGAALDIAPGDTLVTTTPTGLTRIRWLDRKYFWLSLAGQMDADALRVLVNRVR